MNSFLDSILDPTQIQSLDLEQLELLALDIRHRIIEVMSVNGGHLASNLGIVELTIALHKVFHSPHDKLIFDTSHQTYTHKILTGRNSLFPTIRKFKGLSGFAHPDESCHDHFYAGHAGTALSLALGVAASRDLNQENYHVLPILGDASLTCGLTLEALNNLPQSLKRFIIILNDNAMSISKNVGSITNILSRFFHPSQPSCSDTSKKPNNTASFFEHYGLNYLGPIDGHNLKKLIATLELAKQSATPCIIHALTIKGQGMLSAIENPTTYHGARPFEPLTGKFLPTPSTKPTFPQIFGKHLLKMAEEDPNLIVLTPAMPAGSCLTALMEKYPKRCLDVGIAEGHCVTFAGGLAYDKTKKVIVSIYATFLQRAFDNLFQDVCLQKLPVIFALDRAGLAGGDGSTHNGIYDIAFLNAMPNMIIAQPRSGHKLKELLESAFSYNMPVAIRYPNLSTETPNLPLLPCPLGKGEILHKGSHLAILALGHKSETALQVKDLLEKEEIYPTIVDPIFIKPLDEELLYQIILTHPLIVTIEEHSLEGGFGQLINSFAVTHGLKNVILNLGIPSIYVEHGTHTELSKELKLDALSIADTIMEHFSLKPLTPQLS